ncbi:MAG: hypothetical protein QOH39_7 [Verrucomicrobiota bacterium]|jgi:hypothetical protein
MAFRIHDSVVRGEIDNREKGIVRGKIWFEGQSDPIILELRGNAHPDLAGCLLTFVNPRPRIPHPHLDALVRTQRGVAGDLTAAHKVRVFDLPFEEAYDMLKRKGNPPEHLANALYLEWFSETNGRVVIESADYEVSISTPQWQLTPEENEQRARDVAEAMADFSQRLTDAIARHQRGQKDPEEPWNEFDYERLLKESDARTDKYMELLEKYGDSDEAEARITKEMGWDNDEKLSEEETERRSDWIDEMNRACEEALKEPAPEPEPHREGVDWIRTANGDLRHPLQHRCFESAMHFWHQAEALGLQKLEDRDLDQFLSEFQTASVKLGGALQGLVRGDDHRDNAFNVAYLKRALDHLHKAQAGLEGVAPKNLLPEKMLTEARKELLEIRQGILDLMDQFRAE